MTILIAEDDPITLDSLAACVESEGYRTLRAADGRQALALWRTEKPDLICLDIMMPKIDGFELCRRIRRSDTTTPVLFLSAKNTEADVVTGLDLGGDDFIRKPFTRREVIARIQAALRRAGAKQPEETFQLGDLAVHPRRLEAVRGDQRIELTLRDVSILRLLHEHAGQAVSRDAFFDACWGLDYFPDSRTLDQYILLLRKKVEIDPASPTIIHTARGIGYRCG